MEMNHVRACRLTFMFSSVLINDFDGINQFRRCGLALIFSLILRLFFNLNESISSLWPHSHFTINADQIIIKKEAISSLWPPFHLIVNSDSILS